MTRALEVVSTVKLQKVKHKTQNYRDFLSEFFRIAKVIHEKVDLFAHTEKSVSDKTLLIVMSSDKWLCGSINSRLFKKVFAEYATINDQRSTTDVFCVGKKSLDFFVRTWFSTVWTLQIKDNFEGEDLNLLYSFLTKALKDNMYSNIRICFNYFQNTIKQVPVILDLFPLTKWSLDEFVDQIGMDLEMDKYIDNVSHVSDIMFEPSVTVLRKEFMSQFLQHVVYGAMLQNKAWEFSSRMIAMKNAKDNATTMIDDLELRFNKARQWAITQEISEIVSAKMAME